MFFNGFNMYVNDLNDLTPLGKKIKETSQREVNEFLALLNEPSREQFYKENQQIWEEEMARVKVELTDVLGTKPWKNAKDMQAYMERMSERFHIPLNFKIKSFPPEEKRKRQALVKKAQPILMDEFVKYRKTIDMAALRMPGSLTREAQALVLDMDVEKHVEQKKVLITYHNRKKERERYKAETGLELPETEEDKANLRDRKALLDKQLTRALDFAEELAKAGPLTDEEFFEKYYDKASDLMRLSEIQVGNYDKIVEEFGCEPSDTVKERWEALDDLCVGLAPQINRLFNLTNPAYAEFTYEDLTNIRQFSALDEDAIMNYFPDFPEANNDNTIGNGVSFERYRQNPEKYHEKNLYYAAQCATSLGETAVSRFEVIGNPNIIAHFQLYFGKDILDLRFYDMDGNEIGSLDTPEAQAVLNNPETGKKYANAANQPVTKVNKLRDIKAYALFQYLSSGKSFDAVDPETNRFLQRYEGGSFEKEWCALKIPEPILAVEIRGDDTTELQNSVAGFAKDSKNLYKWNIRKIPEYSDMVDELARLDKQADKDPASMMAGIEKIIVNANKFIDKMEKNPNLTAKSPNLRARLDLAQRVSKTYTMTMHTLNNQIRKENEQTRGTYEQRVEREKQEKAAAFTKQNEWRLKTGRKPLLPDGKKPGKDAQVKEEKKPEVKQEEKAEVKQAENNEPVPVEIPEVPPVVEQIEIPEANENAQIQQPQNQKEDPAQDLGKKIGGEIPEISN